MADFSSKKACNAIDYALGKPKASRRLLQECVQSFCADAFYESNPTKTNLVRLVLWHAQRGDVPLERCSWVKKHIDRAHVKQWRDDDIYYGGMRYLQRLTRTSDSSSDEESDSDSSQSKRARSPSPSPSLSPSPSPSPKPKSKPKRASPKRASPKRASPKRASPKRASPSRLTSNPLQSAGAAEPVITTNASKRISELVAIAARDRRVYKVLSKRAPHNSVLYALARCRDDSAALLTDHIVRASAAEAARRGKEQIQTAVVDSVCSDRSTHIGELFATLSEKGDDPHPVLE